jgi:hypothetical protein
MSPDLSFDTHLRLTLARKPALLEEGMRRLAAAWDDYALDETLRSRRPNTLEVIV